MLVATIAPYVSHRVKIAHHPWVDALRFNTIMPLAEDPRSIIEDLSELAGPKPLWIDLKARQLRITEFAYLPFAYVKLSRKINVDLPTMIQFKDCTSEITRIVDGDKLILTERPQRVVGRGEPVNILNPGLSIDGFLTEGDVEFIRAAMESNRHEYMLSFVENDSDIREVLAIDPAARIMAKIESRKGIDWVGASFRDGFWTGDVHRRGIVNLMAARDDLFINMGARKTDIIDALELITSRDPGAYVASRILTSLEKDESVSMGDISDVKYMGHLGFRHFMLSDGICFSQRAFNAAMAVWEQLKQ